jgi:hypothetical protein
MADLFQVKTVEAQKHPLLGNGFVTTMENLLEAIIPDGAETILRGPAVITRQF